ncbi:MAG: hypothetical protein ABJC33_08940 [Betaproteobacteria bacterium]
MRFLLSELWTGISHVGAGNIYLIEVYPPVDAVDHPCYDTFSVEWARRRPDETIWVARKVR